MLSLHKRKRMVLPAVMMAMIMIPAVVLAIGKVIEAQNTSAITYPIPSGYTTITDANFYDCVATEFVKEYPGEEIPSTGLTDEQLGKITKLGCSGSGKNDDEKINNMIGLEKMVGLTSLYADFNKLSSLDLTNNTFLEELLANNNQLTSLDISSNTALTILKVHSNKLASLVISNNLALKQVVASSNRLTSLDASNLTSLETLDVDFNQLNSLYLSNDVALKTLDAWNNQLTSLDVSDSPNIEIIRIRGNQLTSFDVSSNLALRNLQISENQLTLLDVSNNTALESLSVDGNNLTSFDVSNNMALESLSVYRNNLTFLDVSNNVALGTLSADDILIRMDIVPRTTIPSVTYDFSELDFLKNDHQYIDATDNYSYEPNSGILTLTNYAGANGYVQTGQRSEYHSVYKLQLPIFATLNANGGTGGDEMQSCYPNYGESICTITPTAPTRDNYYFLGWADSASATSATYAVGSSITLSEPKTIYAIWAPIYALSFDANGGSGAPAKRTCHPSTTNGSCSVTVPNTAPTLDRHTFLGYADTSDAETASSNYEASKTVTLSANKTIFAVWQRNPIELVDPEISFANSTVSKTYGDGNFANAAITNSDGVVTYSSDNTAVATVNATTGVVTIKGAGSATITANVVATDEYNAGSASYALTVAKATPTISFTNNEVNKVYGDANFTNTATASGNGAITYSSNNTAVAMVNSASGEVTIRGAGRATITANVASTSNYNAVSGTYVLIVSTSTPEISFANSMVTKTYGDEGFTNTATTNSDGAVTYSSNNTTVATVNAATGAVTIRGAGNATITANVAATSSYAGATARYTLVVNKKASVAPGEVEEVKTGYTDDSLSTIPLTTEGLSWEDENTKIREGHNSYRVNYTENNDTANYTTEQFEIVVNGKQKSSGGGSEDEGSSQDGSKDEGKNGIIAVPNTGETTANFDNINVVYCILFAVLMVGLGAGFYVYRNKKAHRKLEW